MELAGINHMPVRKLIPLIIKFYERAIKQHYFLIIQKWLKKLIIHANSTFFILFVICNQRFKSCTAF